MSAQTKRTDKDNAEIYDGFVDTLKDIVKHGETYVDGDGELKRKTPAASTLNVIRQFLKDQNMQATAAHKGLREVSAGARLYPFKPGEDNEGDDDVARKEVTG
jgi:hypothetical protein